MKPIDYLKAAGLGVAVLSANLLLLTLLVTVYSQTMVRDRAPEFYNQLAMDMGQWSGPIGGAVLMFLATYLLGRRRPERNALAFAVAVFAACLSSTRRWGSPWSR
jgi:hypothetical protein